MELPLGGPALRHYTQSRPRPHRQKLNYRPSRPQETIIESENEVLEHMGRVDEGVEEFFTKRVLPADTQKTQDEESSITVHEVAPASSVPCPPPTKTLRRKLGDFFTLKKRRGLKSETSQEGRPKKASIADLIRPLREVARAEKDKDKDRVKEIDKDNEKEKGKEALVAVTGDSAVQEMPVSGAPPLRSEAAPPRRALREGKSQSLILLSGSAAAGSTNAKNTAKKQFDGQHSFEQKLHLMLQRIGVSKAQPEETQNQEGEMKKAESEGTIIDSKPEPPPTFTKPRTMSASSDTRHQIRPSVSAHESAGKPALPPKPVIKSGPPPTASGRNTPENELAQIQEGETKTPTKLSPTKLSPTATSSTPAPIALSASTPTPTEPTISDSIPDSTNFTISPSSTVTPSDTDLCTDSVSPSAADTVPMNVTELDSKASVAEVRVSVATTVLSASISTFPTSTATPTKTPTPVSVISTSSESITQSHSVTSSSTTITAPSITTLETVSAPTNESRLSTATSTNLSATSCLPVPNGTSSADTIAADSDAAILAAATADTASAVTTSTSTTSANDLMTSDSVTTTSSVDPISSVAKTTSPPPNSNNTTDTAAVTTPASPDTPLTSSAAQIVPVSAALSPTSSTPSTTTDTTSPTITDCMTSISTSALTPPATTSTPDISVPSTSSGTAGHLDTISTTTISTTTAAISAQPTTEPEPVKDISTTLTPAIPCPPVTDSSSATSHPLTSPAPSSGSVGQDDLQTPAEGGSSLEPAATVTAAEELETIKNNEKTDQQHKKVGDGGKDDERAEKEKSTVVNSEGTQEGAREESTKADEDDKKDVAVDEAPSGKEGEGE